MRDIPVNNLILSVAAAIVLIFCLGVTTFAMILISRGEDAIENANADDSDATGCAFTSQLNPLPLYAVPAAATSQQAPPAQAGVAYPIIHQNRGYYLLQINDELTAYADSRDGTIDGDCDDVPLDDKPLAEFPTACVFTNDAETVLFSETELVNMIGSVPPGTYLVDMITTDRYYVVLDETLQGWVLGTEGTVSGACDAIIM